MTFIIAVKMIGIVGHLLALSDLPFKKSIKALLSLLKASEGWLTSLPPVFKMKE